MISVRGPGKNSVMVGRSVHNQRIERFWRDVYEQVVNVYYNLFRTIEDTFLLDLGDPVTSFLYQYFFYAALSKSIDDFRLSWNLHRLSTAGNRSPVQLMEMGKMQGLSAAESIENLLLKRVSKKWMMASLYILCAIVIILYIIR